MRRPRTEVPTTDTLYEIDTVSVVYYTGISLFGNGF